MVTQDDIGVVSPYKRQCEKIRLQLTNNGYGDIVVGPAETFQGQERRIMFISTVRTGEDIGFVRDAQVTGLWWTSVTKITFCESKSETLNNGNPFVFKKVILVTEFRH